MVSFQSLSVSWRNEVALRDALDAAQTPANSQPTIVKRGVDEPPKNQKVNDASETLDFDFVGIENVPENSQYNMRRVALKSGVPAKWKMTSTQVGSNPISLGDARRVLAFAGNDRDGLRRLDSLRP